MKLLLRWVITAIALFVAVRLVPGITVETNASAWTLYAVMAIIFGLVNALVRPILSFLSCPLIFLTFGLFIFVVNAVAFWLSAWVAGQLGVGFYVGSFVAALLGSIVVSIVSTILTIFVSDDEE